MVNWEIAIMNVNGSARITYSNVNPGGIVSSIQYDVEPSGNCLTASFQGIPNKLDIQPRDFIQIKVGGVNKFYGYLSNYVNPAHSDVVTYQVEGLKSLLYHHLISEFWYYGTPDGDGMTSHRQLVSELNNHLPYYVTSTISNQASTMSGNKAPIIFSNDTFGVFMDSTVAAASDATYVWGVDANRTVFIKPTPTNLVNLDPLRKRVKYNSQNTDQVVTAIRFQFTVPTAYLGEDMTTTLTRRDNRADDNEQHSTYEPGVRTYEYEDTALSAVYGKFTRKVPLVLSGSWMREVTLEKYETENPAIDVLVTPNGTGAFVTNTGGTTNAQLKAALASPTGFVRNVERTLAEMTFRFTNKTTGVDVPDRILGIKYDYELEASPRLLRSYANTYYYRPGRSPYKAVDYPLWDVHTYMSDSPTEGLTYGTKRLFYFARSFKDWEVDPSTVKPDGRPVRTVVERYYGFGFEAGSQIPANTLRIRNVRIMTLNEQSLINYAKTLIKSPVNNASEVTLTQDLGLAARATLNGSDAYVVRIKTEISRAAGFAVTYVIGDDPERNNQVLNRFFERDDRASVQAIDVAMGRV